MEHQRADSGDGAREVDRLLRAIGEGDAAAAEALVPVVYGELRAIARGHLAGERAGHSLQSTALVHEAYLRLVGDDPWGGQWANRAHFFAAAAQAMRRILVDRARARGRLKRGGPGRQRVALEDAAVIEGEPAGDLVALDAALDRLAEHDPRKHEVVMLRHFAGLTIEQVAETLGVSPATVKNDWSYARAWLHRALDEDERVSEPPRPIDDIFAAALRLAPGERALFLEANCPDEAARAEVESLLAHHDASADFLGTPAVEQAFDVTAAVPERIGPYRILDTLGEGGFGVVYLAEQAAPIERRVALKIVKPGMDSRRVLERFRTEEQTLARLDHPHIARVFDAGVTDQGRPYFVMEHVAGAAITKHCDARGLELTARLELFIEVCDAVQHAHQNGIIHRDLKPSNILVTEAGAPRVIDFGVAKALDQAPSTQTVFTELGHLVGTPAYMSPEQIGLEPLDTRSDVYALGVLLYELITGAMPLDPGSVEGTSFTDIQRIVREVDPPRPSTHVRALRGDLDWITMKAMEKDPARRYATASELAADVRRHLRDEPVVAGPPSTVYRLAKFTRRHRAGVAAAALVAATVLAGVSATAWQAVRAMRAERRALAEAAIAGAVNDFLNDDLLAAVDPKATADREITVREALDAASERIEGRFDDQPEVEAAVRHTIGRTYVNLGAYTLAEPHLVAARRLWTGQRGAGDPRTLSVADTHAELLFMRGDMEACVEVLVETLALRRESPGEAHLDTLTNMGNLARTYNAMRRHDEAEPLVRRDMEISLRVLGPDHGHTLSATTELAYMHMLGGRFDEAEPLVEAILDSRRRQLGPDHPDTLEAMNNLATIYRRRDRLDDAADLYAQTLAACERVLGPEHPHTLRTASNLGQVQVMAGRPDEAAAILDATLAIQRRTLGAIHRDTLNTIERLVSARRGQGRTDDAEALCAAALADLRAEAAPDDPRIAALESFCESTGQSAP